MIRPSRGGDRGSATLWMVLGTVVVFAMAGLVFDGGALISTNRDAINDAEQAARAGAQAIDVAQLYDTGATPRLDPAAAASRAEAFLATNGWQGTATADAGSVTVTVTRDQSMTFLAVFGVGDRPVTGTATARAQAGLVGP